MIILLSSTPLYFNKETTFLVPPVASRVRPFPRFRTGTGQAIGSIDRSEGLGCGGRKAGRYVVTRLS